MAKTASMISLYIKKVEKLIKLGLITEDDILDTDVKTEYLKKKSA